MYLDLHHFDGPEPYRWLRIRFRMSKLFQLGNDMDPDPYLSDFLDPDSVSDPYIGVFVCHAWFIRMLMNLETGDCTNADPDPGTIKKLIIFYFTF